MSIADNIEFLRRFSTSGTVQDGLGAWGLTPDQNPLVETVEFGANPGHLAMYSYVPEGLSGLASLVVVLHGCGQTAAGYNVGAGWSTLADRYGFALLMPEQRRANNANTCFNWFDAADIVRDGGEAASIRQMIARMVHRYPIDEKRVFVTGLSAGGAMTSVMLATYPEVFKAGAIIAGLPYGVATNLRDALGAMRRPDIRSAKALGQPVRQASRHRGPWPQVSVWHGSGDRTVHPDNAGEIVKQWLDVHGLPATPMSQGLVDGYPRQVWWGADGETLVESYTITDMGHGTPLGFGNADERYGAQGPFMIEAGISSSYYIAQFFGLIGPARQPKSAPQSFVMLDQPRAKPEAAIATAPAGEARGTPRRKPALDVNAVITRALTAAGLMK